VTGRTSGPYKPVPLLCIVFLLEQAEEKRQEKPEAKDVLPNINRTPPAERAEKCCFFVPGDLDLQTRPSEGPNMSSV